jgi:antitoxin MazE
MQRLTRWGNSCGLRLGMGVLEAAGLKIGDYVSIRTMDSGDVRIRPARRVPVEVEDTDSSPKIEQQVLRW